MFMSRHSGPYPNFYSVLTQANFQWGHIVAFRCLPPLGVVWSHRGSLERFILHGGSVFLWGPDPKPTEILGKTPNPFSGLCISSWALFRIHHAFRWHSLLLQCSHSTLSLYGGMGTMMFLPLPMFGSISLLCSPITAIFHLPPVWMVLLSAFSSLSLNANNFVGRMLCQSRLHCTVNYLILHWCYRDLGI